MKTLLCCLLALLPAVALADPVRPAVYVFTQTDPSGLTDAASKARTETVAGLLKVLQKSQAVQIVTTRDEATIVLEVTKEAMIDEPDSLHSLINTLNTTAGGLQATRPKEAETKQVANMYATLQVGEYSTEIFGHTKPYGKGLAKALEKWVQMNQAHLK